MAIDGKLMAKARERLAEIKEKNEALGEERREEVYKRLPEVKTIEERLRAIMGQVISASLKGEAGKRELAALEKESLLLCGDKVEALVAAGYSADYLDGVYYCDKCHDMGYDRFGNACSCLMKLYEEEKSAYLSSIPGHEGDSFAAFSLVLLSFSEKDTPQYFFSNLLI